MAGMSRRRELVAWEMLTFVFLGQSLQNSVKVWAMETTAIVTHGGVTICASCLFANWSV